MSPNEFDKYRNDFVEAATKFGWTRYAYTQGHERDSYSSMYLVDAWKDPQGRFLIDESDITEAMAEELIRISKLIKE